MTVTLTKTRMIASVCEGIFAGVIDAPPQIAVTHHGEQVDGAVIKKAAQSDDWVLHVPIPVHLLADGVQTYLISDVETGETLTVLHCLQAKPWPKISVKRWHCCAKSWTCSKAHFAGTASKPHSLTWRSG